MYLWVTKNKAADIYEMQEAKFSYQRGNRT